MDDWRKGDDWCAGQIDLPGVHPVRQERSRLLMQRLLEAGLDLLNEHDFDGLSIERICQRTGVTIGSFYSRFESKPAYVHALQRIVVGDAMARMRSDYEAGNVPSDSLVHALRWITKGAAVWYRRHEGLVRASLRQPDDPSAWVPIRELGRTHVALAVPHIEALLGRQRDEQTRQTIRFAFQIMLGTLNHMVLINPGPFSIHDSRTPQLLANAMQHVIEAGAVEPPLERKPARRMRARTGSSQEDDG